MFFEKEHFTCSRINNNLIIGFWLCLSKQLAKHERIVNVQSVEGGEIPKGAIPKRLQITRHVEDHLKDRDDLALKKRADMVKKMNKAFACKISASNLPNYNITPEEVQFLYTFGELALKTKQNPIHFLHIDKRTLHKDIEHMANKLMAHTKKMISKLHEISKVNKMTLIVSKSVAFDHKFFSDGSIDANLGYGRQICLRNILIPNSEKKWDLNIFEPSMMRL